MKQLTSTFLVVLIIFQNSFSFAQSSVQNEMYNLQYCMNERFDELSARVEKYEGAPILLNSQARLEYAKYIMEGLLFQIDAQNHEFAKDTKYYGSMALVGLTGVFISKLKSAKAKTVLASLDQKHSIIRLNGTSLVNAGGEEALLAEQRFYKSAIRNTRFGTGVLVLFTAIVGFFAVKALNNLATNTFTAYGADEQIEDLRNSTTEYDFYKALRSEHEHISQLRKEMIIACDYTSTSELLDIVTALMNSTEAERLEAFLLIEQQADTLFQE